MCGGQPRFTQSFLILMQQLKGFDVADMYMCLWATHAVPDSETTLTSDTQSLIILL